MTNHQEALTRLTRWRDAGSNVGMLIAADSARHEFCSDVSALLDLVARQQEALTMFTKARFAIDHGGPANSWALGRLHEAWCKACDCLPAPEAPHDR